MTENKSTPWVRMLVWSGLTTILLAVSTFWPAHKELYYMDGQAINFASYFGETYSMITLFTVLGIIFDSIVSFVLMTFILYLQSKSAKPHAEAGIASVFFAAWVTLWMIFNNFLLFAFTPAHVNVAGIFAAAGPLIAVSGGIILGIIYGIISFFQPGRIKWLGILGIVLNILSGPIAVLLVFLIPEGFLA